MMYLIDKIVIKDKVVILFSFFTTDLNQTYINDIVFIKINDVNVYFKVFKIEVQQKIQYYARQCGFKNNSKVLKKINLKQLIGLVVLKELDPEVLTKLGEDESI